MNNPTHMNIANATNNKMWSPIKLPKLKPQNFKFDP